MVQIRTSCVNGTWLPRGVDVLCENSRRRTTPHAMPDHILMTKTVKALRWDHKRVPD